MINWSYVFSIAIIGLIVGMLMGGAMSDWKNDIEDRIERLEQVADSTAIER